VNVSSLSYKQGSMDFDNLLFETGKDFTPMKAYARSKLANILFTYELKRFFESKGIDCMAIAAHPGIANTKNSGKEEKTLLKNIDKLSFSYLIQPPSMGALPEIRASVDPKVNSGDFYVPGGLLELSGNPVVVQPKFTSFDVEQAYKLWVVSERLTSVTFQ